ncbi:hypothetical protein HG530_007938 [Fusarium avenaceum]|nr:hypothetical protein HG530_007938 [Fusarium avenaceum]
MAGSTIGKLQAALTAATNEVTVAAANINFDFTLVKFEAPKEYQPLGTVLSAKRKHDAEHGKDHVTARRLYALFEDSCPDTPNLIRAYGERVSYISKLATDSVSKKYSDSIFSAFTGVDGTSIWAAVTSSQSSHRGAIHVHLLACILATMWDPPEATSIWYEIVKLRRQNIASQLENNVRVSFATASAAAQQEIPRSQLAEWDASARAWIETADNVMVKKQTQLKLILKNVGLVIGKTDDLYASVMQTWHIALSIMESLVSGIPQEVQDGVALLALSAWHLYPDVQVFGSTTVEVQMDDQLIKPGGILTIGCTRAATTPTNGVSWSLPLSHLRHYGYPVLKTAHLQDDPNNLSCNEFHQVVLGCVLQIWGVKEDHQLEMMDLLSRLSNGFGVKPQNPRLQKVLAFLRYAMEGYHADPQLGIQLIALGRRRSNFIPCVHDKTEVTIRAKSLFGLTDVTTFMTILRRANLHVAYLRRVCQRFLSPELVPIIRYSYEPGAIVTGSTDTQESLFHAAEKSSEGPTSTSPEGDLHDTLHDVDMTHDTTSQAMFATAFQSSPMLVHQGSSVRSESYHTRWFSGFHKPGIVANNFLLFEMAEPEYSIDYVESGEFERIMPTSFIRNHNGRQIEYEFMFGDRQHGAIFLPRQAFAHQKIPQLKVDHLDLKWAVEDAGLGANEQLHGHSIMNFTTDSVFQSLYLLYEAMKALESLSGKVIRTQILRKSLPTVLWVRESSSAPVTVAPLTSFRQHISLASFFVAGLELRPEEISTHAMGLSVGNSIFVQNRVSFMSDEIP